MVNILSGGLHAGRNFEFQDFLAAPHGFTRYSDALSAVVVIHRFARELLEKQGHVLTGVADEGGWGPRLSNNEAALDLLTRAIAAAGFPPGKDVSIAIDIASTHFYADGRYNLPTEGRSLTSAEMTQLLWRLGSTGIRSSRSKTGSPKTTGTDGRSSLNNTRLARPIGRRRSLHYKTGSDSTKGVLQARGQRGPRQDESDRYAD
jgi:hypothetical protein